MNISEIIEEMAVESPTIKVTSYVRSDTFYLKVEGRWHDLGEIRLEVPLGRTEITPSTELPDSVFESVRKIAKREITYN